MSDLHTYKVMQEGDADGNDRAASSRSRANGWLVFAVVLLSLFIIAAIMFPYFTFYHDHGPGPSHTISNLKQIALANLIYATDYDEHLPLADNWMDVLEPYTKNEDILHDPEIKDRKVDEYGYAFFKPISGVDTRAVRDPEKVPLVFQSILMLRNARSDLSTLPVIPRNGKANCVAFIDGHAKAFPPTWPEHPITVVIDPSLAKETRE